MRNFKKISAIVLVIAMLFSMMSISAFAEGEAETKFTVKCNNEVGTASVAKVAGFDSVSLDVYYSGIDDSIAEASGLNFIVQFDKTDLTKVEAIPNTAVYKNVKNQGNLNQGRIGFRFSTSDYVDRESFKADSKIGTIKFTFDSAKISSLSRFEVKVAEPASTSATGKKFVQDGENYVTENVVVDTASVPMTITFTDPLQASAVTTTIPEITKPYGTAQKYLGLIPAVDVSTVLQSDGTTPGTPKTNVAVDWSNATYDPYATDDQNLVGTLITTDPVGFKVDGITVTQKVKHSPIAYTATEPVATAKVKAFKEDKTDDSDGSKAVKEALADKNKIALTVKDGATEAEKITDEITVDWANASVTWSGDIKTVNSTATVTYTFTADNTPSKKGYYNVAKDTVVTATVTVIPANIEGGSFELTDSTFVPNTKPAVKVTVPASEVAKLKLSTEAGGEAESNRQIVAKIGDKETDVATDKFTDDEIKAARKAVENANGDAEKIAALAPYTKTVTFSKTLSDLGYGYGDDDTKAFTVSVTVGGTTLLAGTKEDGTGIEEIGGTVVKPSSGGSSGSIGINKGNTTKTYAVTVVETKNGTATVSPEKAASGATVTVKPEPAEGYKVKSVTAVKADGTNVPVDEKALTFTMPASAVKVTVEFEEGKDEPVNPTPDGKFADVADDFWAAKDIYTLKDAGIIGGKSATEFDPEGDVTRAEFAKMVVGLFGYKATSDAVNFEDCKAEDWFTPYVAAGVEAGVIKGVSDTEFAPNATITREDACTILGRALNKVAQSNELKFTDADKVAEYAAPYVALLSELGYVNGYEDGSFAPTNNITRAEAAKIIAGIYNAKDSTEDKADNTDTIDVAPEK